MFTRERILCQCRGEVELEVEEFLFEKSIRVRVVVFGYGYRLPLGSSTDDRRAEIWPSHLLRVRTNTVSPGT